MNKKPILLVEDDDNDILFFQIAAKKAGITRPMIVLRDGLAVIDYLSGQNQYADRSVQNLPCVMFLDLKLPKKNGLEVLAWMKTRPDLLGLVTIVMTSSVVETDINTAYELGANSYLVKQGDPEKFVTLLELIDQYWLRANIFPPSAE